MVLLDGALRPRPLPADGGSTTIFNKVQRGRDRRLSRLSERRNSLGLQISPLKGLEASRSVAHPALKAPLFLPGRCEGRTEVPALGLWG